MLKFDSMSLRKSRFTIFILIIFNIFFLGFGTIWCIYHFINKNYYSIEAGAIPSLYLSFIASLSLILVLFLLVKPSLIISDKIASSIAFNIDYDTNTFNNNVDWLRIKIINYSLFKATDLKATLYFTKPIQNSGKHSQYTHFYDIPITIPFIAGLIDGAILNYPYNTHCYQMKITKEMSLNQLAEFKHALTTDSNAILLVVNARHSFSGLISTKNVAFDNLNEHVIKGSFKDGLNLNIIV